MVLIVRDVSYVPCVGGRSQSRPKHAFNLPHLHVLRLGALIRCDLAYMRQRVVTGDNYIFYSGIYFRCHFKVLTVIM